MANRKKCACSECGSELEPAGVVLVEILCDALKQCSFDSLNQSEREIFIRGLMAGCCAGGAVASGLSEEGYQAALDAAFAFLLVEVMGQPN